MPTGKDSYAYAQNRDSLQKQLPPMNWSRLAWTALFSFGVVVTSFLLFAAYMQWAGLSGMLAESEIQEMLGSFVVLQWIVFTVAEYYLPSLTNAD